MKKLRVAIVGFGGIARVHNTAYHRLINEGFPVEVVAVCEKNTARVRENVTINLGGEQAALDESVHIYSDVDELIAKEDFDMADICLPTFLHKDFSIKLLRAGKHVLCEKPMALSSSDCDEMIAAAKESSRILMIGMCLRFDPCYNYLKQTIDSGEMGELKYLTMYRHSVYPIWGADFSNFDRTGGCILDTHIHDVDIARYLLGEPTSISSVWHNDLPHCQVVNSRLNYNGLPVIIDCAWDEARDIPFKAGYRAIFEKGSLVCRGNSVTVWLHGKEPTPAILAPGEYMTEEIRAMASAVLGISGREKLCAPEESRNSVALVERLRASAEGN